MTKQELDNQLVEVRKAYRLLYSYQKRVLHTIKYISQNLGFEYAKDIPYYMENKRKSLECSAWDWLNMYSMEFRMYPKELNNKKLHLSFLLLSDTAIFKDGLSMDSIEEFEDAEKSKTKLALIFSDVELNDDHFLAFLDDGDIFNYENSADEHKSFYESPFDDSEDEFCLIEEPHKVFIKRYDLSDFLNQQSTDVILKELNSEVTSCM